MIAHIKGEIIHTEEKFIIIEANNIGYKVFLSTDTILGCEQGEEKSLWTYMAVRENSLDLYGFETKEEHAFFESLLDVSGIGPKSALSILNVAPVETLKRAIATGDTAYLNKVSGIGKKTAEKIIIELRDKLLSYKNEDGVQSMRDEGDIIEALKSLGYSQTEARETVKKIPNEIEKTSEKIKEALKILATRN
jgi:Holliday junction DNA helicase RuvA